MASEHNIVIKFASSFIDKGIAAMQKAMTSTGRMVARMVARMAGAFGSLADAAGSGIGKVVGSLGELGTMIAQGGVWGMMAYGATKAIEKITEMLNSAKKAAAEAARAIGESFSGVASTIEKRFKSVASAIDRAASAARAVDSARRARRSADAAAASASIDASTRDALAKARDDSERAVINANAQLEKAKLAAAAAERDATAAAEIASGDEELARKRLAAAQEAFAEAQKQRGVLAEELAAAMKTGDKNAVKTIRDAVKKADAAISGFMEQEEQFYHAMKVAEFKTAEQESDLRKTRAESANAIAQAEYNLAAAVENREKAERKRKYELELRRDRISREMTEYVDKAAKDERKREAEKAMEAQRDADKELQRGFDRSIEKLVGEIKLIEKAAERTNRGVAKDNSGYQYHFGDNGRINDFEDWQRAQRFAKRDDRDRRNAERHNEWLKNDLEEKERRGRLSESDARRLKQLRQFNEERKGEERRQQQIEDLRKKQQQAIIDSEKHLKALKEKVDKFVESGVLQ